MSFSAKLTRYLREAYRYDHFPSTWDAFTSSKPKLAYFGFLGDKNLGDEMVYWGARELFSDCLLIPVKRRSPVGIKFATKGPTKFFDGIVQGGGTLINQSSWDAPRRELFSSGLPIYVHGTGVLDANPNSDWELLSKKTYGGVRGPISKELLCDVAELPCIGDAAFALEINDNRKRDRKRSRILINLGTHKHNEYDCSEKVEDQLIEFSKRVMGEGFEVAFLPFHGIDASRGLAMKERLPSIHVLKQPTTLDTLGEYFDSAAFALGERLHFIVSAVLFDCPFLSINYASKHFDFLRSIDIECFGSNPDECSVDRMMSGFEARNDCPSHSHTERVDTFRSIQCTEAQQFLSDVNQTHQRAPTPRYENQVAKGIGGEI